MTKAEVMQSLAMSEAEIRYEINWCFREESEKETEKESETVIFHNYLLQKFKYYRKYFLSKEQTPYYRSSPNLRITFSYILLQIVSSCVDLP